MGFNSGFKGLNYSGQLECIETGNVSIKKQ